jgi:glycosyltransferase involved in cell wall biosynthesis
MAGLRPGASLLVVGAGPLDNVCRAQAERLGVRAVWAGFLNQSELGRTYAVADCLVLPSGGETWGLVVNEALATGLPAIVSDRVGCGPDLVRADETGAIFPMGDAGALAAAIERIRAGIEASVDYAAACRARAVDHGLDRATAGLVAACQVVTRARRAGDSRQGAR